MALVEPMMESFIRGTVDAVYVVYAKFNSVLSTPPTAERILPVSPPEKTGTQRDYLLFPSAEAILSELLPLYVRNVVYRALVETGDLERRIGALEAGLRLDHSCTP